MRPIEIGKLEAAILDFDILILRFEQTAAMAVKPGIGSEFSFRFGPSLDAFPIDRISVEPLLMARGFILVHLGQTSAGLKDLQDSYQRATGNLTIGKATLLPLPQRSSSRHLALF